MCVCVDECLWKPNSSREEEEEEEEVWGFIAELKNFIVLQREDTKSTLYKSPRGVHVCVHILVQASSCGPIRVLLSVIWGHFIQASLGQTWDCLIRFKVSIRTGVYSKVWITDLTKANVCVCESALQYMYVRLVSVVTPSSIVHILLSKHQGFKHTHWSIYHCEAFD